MASAWHALYRPGRTEPEAVDCSKGDLVDLALRRGIGRPPFLAGTAKHGQTYPYLTRDAAWKRLRRRGWRIEALPERFWVAPPLRRLLAAFDRLESAWGGEGAELNDALDELRAAGRDLRGEAEHG